MSAEFSITLAVASLLIFLARLVLPQLPLRRAAVRLSAIDLALLVVGVVGLTFHCTAMFYRQLFDTVPEIAPLVDAVNGMSVASVVLYVGPALLLLIGLRRQHWVPLVLALALIAVGITMYNGGSLQLHLAAIFVAVLVLVGVISTVVVPPWQRAPKPEGGT
ncbi:MAG: hypothetical protein ACOH10_06590 [Rhodoglobus sp.]